MTETMTITPENIRYGFVAENYCYTFEGNRVQNIMARGEKVLVTWIVGGVECYAVVKVTDKRLAREW